MRPLSVTIVAWWLIITAALGIYSSATMASNPVVVGLAAGSSIPLAAQQYFGIINGFVLILCGMAILKGTAWARPLFVAWTVIGFLFGIFVMGFIFALILSGLSLTVITFFLSRPRANDWFAT